MINEHLFREFREIWGKFLGKTLISAKQRFDESLYLLKPELIEIVYHWDDFDSVSYISYKQPDPDLFHLSVSENSYFGEDEVFAESNAESNDILSKALQKRHTFFELYGNEIGYPLALLLGFENEYFAVAVGSEELEGIFKDNNHHTFELEFSNLHLLTMFEFKSVLQNKALEPILRLQT